VHCICKRRWRESSASFILHTLSSGNAVVPSSHRPTIVLHQCSTIYYALDPFVATRSDLNITKLLLINSRHAQRLYASLENRATQKPTIIMCICITGARTRGACSKYRLPRRLQSVPFKSDKERTSDKPLLAEHLKKVTILMLHL
jgi:hypothetical protein